MAYNGYDHRDQHRRHDSYGYSRHEDIPSVSSQHKLTPMPHSKNPSGYSYSPSHSSYDPYDRRYAASSAHPTRRPAARRKHTWPPGPSVEDEKVSLAKEVPSSRNKLKGESDGDAIAPGDVDQYPIIQDNPNRPKVDRGFSDDRRFVLVSDPSAEADAKNAAARRRRSGNIPPLKTDLDPPVFTERVPTPYAYTKPQKESLAPSPGGFSASPEHTTPRRSPVPTSVPKRDAWDAQRDQNARPSTNSIPDQSRHDSFSKAPRSPRHDVFDDSDSDSATYLRTERQPARYSFVKSDLQKEDLRTNLMDSQTKSDKRRLDQETSGSRNRRPYDSTSSGSSKNPTPGDQSPRSSDSSVHNAYASRQKDRRAPAETGYVKEPNRYPSARHSRPVSPIQTSSPLRRERMESPPRSPRVLPRRSAGTPLPARPFSGVAVSRPASPSSSTTPRLNVTDSDWHATYPPAASNNRARHPNRFTRNESMPVPAPRIDVQSPSPARPQKPENPLPYPMDERLADIYMPPEEAYQYDHAYRPASPNPSLRSPYPDSPKLTQSPIPGSPRDRPPAAFNRTSVADRFTAAPEELPRRPRARSNSFRSQSSNDGPRTSSRTLGLDRPMPSCPRSELSGKYDDWYTLESCPNFDICPSCYLGVFADTPFSTYFRPVRRSDERFCDFSTPWMRLAWLLTIKQQRNSPDLIYQLATIEDIGQPCPKDREVPSGLWYGLPDQRDGVHVSNFSVCPTDVKMLEALCPSIRGYLTRLPTYGPTHQNYTCSLRTTSKRFPKYLGLLVEIDEESRLTGRAPDIERFIKLIREDAFLSECAKDTQFTRRPWHYIPNLPEFTVCEECYSDLVFPAIQQKNSVANLFNRASQLVPGEDSHGTSCQLYSPRMRRVWERVLEDEDYTYLKRKAVARKKAEARLSREKAELLEWLGNMRVRGEYRDGDLDRLTNDLRIVEEEWKDFE